MSKYSRCPECGKKGVYGPAFIPASGEIIRCRYCGWTRNVDRIQALIGKVYRKLVQAEDDLRKATVELQIARDSLVEIQRCRGQSE